MAGHTLRYPEMLVTCDWLADHLDDPGLRVFDTTVHLGPSGAESGRAGYEAGHLPGAGFLDHQEDLSDPESEVLYTRLDPDRLAAAFAVAGVSDDSRVVVYSAGHAMWATRVLWLLRGIGFDRASVLDGGLARWQAEGRPTSKQPCTYPAGTLTPRPRPEVWADRDEVRTAIADRGVCTINALPHKLHTGEAELHYGRPGRIAGSRNVPFTRVVDSDTGGFTSPDLWRAEFETTGALASRRAITYCGGGISATVAAFALLQLGHPDVAVYDGSLHEWCADETLPMETGDPAAG